MEGAASRLSLAGHVRLPLGAASGRAETSCAIPAFPAGRRPPHPAPIRGLSTGARPRSPVPLLASSPSGSECSALFGPLPSGGKNEQLKVRASSIPESAGESSFVSAAAKTSPERGDIVHTLYLGVLFALWYLLNVYFYIYNKQVLKVYPFPMTITAAHLAMGTSFILFGWMSNLMKRPKISSSQFLAIVPLAIVHTLGNLFTNMSLGKVSVSFTHTIKAMEPFFTVVLSAVFLGEMPSLLVLLSLVPIAGGVALASLTEVSFNWIGFWSAMASNLANQSRNVLSKKLMAKKEESLDNITLFSIITIMSFFLTVPIAILAEGVNLMPNLQPTGLNLNDIYVRSLLAGVCFHAYQQVSYMILEYVSPVTHSVGNCVKRVVVIVASVLFFRTPVSPINALGTGVALAGVFSYSGLKRLRQKPKLA